MRSPELISLARVMAVKHELPPPLVCAVIEQESDWNEYAQRYEPAFMSRYVGPLFTKGGMTHTEAYSRAYSWGLMQIMGQVAREMGFAGHFLSELCAPINAIEYGCRKLAACMKNAAGDEAKALLAYNGGGDPDYPAHVLERKNNYTEAA